MLGEKLNRYSFFFLISVAISRQVYKENQVQVFHIPTMNPHIPSSLVTKPTRFTLIIEAVKLSKKVAGWH
jgi:hypothetical protein